MKKNYHFIGILAVAGMFMMTSCRKDINPDAEVSYDEIIASGGEFADFGNYKTLTNTNTSSVTVDSGTWNCSYNTWSVQQGNLNFPIYDPNVSVVYPGSLLQGASLNSATPDVVAVRRGGGTVSIDLVNGSFSVAVPIAEIKKSTVAQALNDIMANNNEVMPARFTLSNELVRSTEELALGLGLNLDIYIVSAAGNLSFSNKANTTSYLVALRQSFYTMSFDIPYNYNELFHKTVKPMDLAKYVGPNNPACYVSDVTYGRVFYLLIESSSTATEIEAAIAGSYNGDSASFNASYLSSLENLNVKVMSLGGEVQATFSTIDTHDLPTLTNMLAQGADIKTGVPISYVVRTVYNNKLVKNKINLEYTLSDCQLVP